MHPLWIIAWIILLILLIFFIILYYMATATLVAPSQCGASYGLYSVSPGATAVPLQGCQTGSGQCDFTFASLAEAIQNCDDNADLCQAFYYSEVSRVMTYLQTESAETAATQGGIYRRQVNPVIVSQTIT